VPESRYPAIFSEAVYDLRALCGLAVHSVLCVGYCETVITDDEGKKAVSERHRPGAIRNDARRWKEFANAPSHARWIYSRSSTRSLELLESVLIDDDYTDHPFADAVKQRLGAAVQVVKHNFMNTKINSAHQNAGMFKAWLMNMTAFWWVLE
jgi:hypothetical protein